MTRSFYARYAWPIMIVLVALLPPVIWGIKGTLEAANNHIRQWLPQGFQETERYDEFRKLFGPDDFALVSWEGCKLHDQEQMDRLEKLASELVPPAGNRREGDGSKWFKEVVTGPRALKTLTSPPFNLSPEEARARLEGTLIGRGLQTCAVVTLSDAGDADRTAALEALEDIATGRCAIDRQQLRLGGEAVANAAIDIESERAIRQWIGLSSLVALAVAWCCLRSIKLTVMVFVVAEFSSALATAAVHYTGGTMNLVLVVMPVLVYVLALSASVHLCNYYRDAVRESGVAGAPVRAMAAGWTPCALSAVTTALGLISLYVSHIVPVKMFGVYAAVGVLMSLAVLFLVLPAAMETWPVAGGSEPAGGDRLSAGRQNRLLRRLASLVVRHRRWVLGICLGLLVFFAFGAALVKTTIQPLRFFSPRSRWVEDGEWLQDRLGALVPFEVILRFDKIRFDKDYPLSFLERMELVHWVEQTIRGMESVGGTISAATFGPKLDDAPRPWERGAREVIGRSVLNTRLLQNRDRLADTNYLHISPEKDEQDQSCENELWRISARVKAFENVDYDEFLRSVEGRVNAFLHSQAAKQKYPPSTVRAVYTGAVPLLFVAQRELLGGLWRSFCLAFVMISVVMVFLLRNILAGLLVMLPNLFPALVTFGTMGWTASLVDVGAMMTAGVALGIAVDDTLHFLTWFRRALHQGQSRAEAIVDAYGRCAPAMTQTTLIAGLGLLVFYLSSFQPVFQFGLLMFILLVAALVGDLVLLPAMLATRLGKCFECNKVARAQAEATLRQ